MNLREKVRGLEPWRHNIDLGPFTTFEVARSRGPNKDIHHPKPRWNYVKQWLPEEPGTALDIGCNAGCISFELEALGWKVTGIDNCMDERLGCTGNPIKQANLCKDVFNSNVTFIETGAMEYLPCKFDLIVALCILYHISETGDKDRDTEMEKQFVDKMIESARERIIIETTKRSWLRDYLREQPVEIIAHKSPSQTPEGSRQVVVIDPI